LEDTPLYQQIAAHIRQQILDGALRPGDRLPSLRQMTRQWNCNTGTVQRAYQELARQGLVTSRPGQGTRVAGSAGTGSRPADTPIRRARLVNQAEAFLLEALAGGYNPEEVIDALHQAADRWRSIEPPEPAAEPDRLRFTGSHDPALARLTAGFTEAHPQISIELRFAGSLSGLMALAEGRADLAGCHLWDAETDSYNEPFIRRILPGRPVTLLTLAHRRLGLIVPPGNPRGLTGLADLTRPGLTFINRQPGSGTRVWLEAQLQRLGISPASIRGYGAETATHTEVARAVAAGQADAGLGLEAAALAYGLDFIFLTRERYDLVLLRETAERLPASAFLEWLSGAEPRQWIRQLGGYDLSESGTVYHIN